jgi:chitinase
VFESKVQTVDDPATSPYPVWRERREYDKGASVVWRGDVYEAKWWNVAQPPDAPVVNEWDSPWRLIGPVMPNDIVTTTTTTTIAPGTYPAWSRTDTYQAGDRVEWHGIGYEAKWWTRGEQPGRDVDNDWETAWAIVSAADDEQTAKPAQR